MNSNEALMINQWNETQMKQTADDAAPKPVRMDEEADHDALSMVWLHDNYYFELNSTKNKLTYYVDNNYPYA